MVDDLESVDDMAGRLADQCRELINEGVTQYFGRLLAASGQRETRVVNIPKVTKESRKGTTKVIRSQGGSKGRMRIYSMQDVDDLEGLPADD